MDLARVLRERLREAFQSGPEPTETGPETTADSGNGTTRGQVISVYTDANVTIIHRTGEVPVIRPDGEWGDLRRRASVPVVPKGQKSQR